jgi:predicted nucleic acid-binding protein
MRILFDTNVLLDVLLFRDPWYQEGYTLWQFHDRSRLKGYVTATTVTDIFYVCRRFATTEGAFAAVRTCLTAFPVIAVGQEKLERALQLPGKDFEDNLQVVCADALNLEAIVTRNPTDFAHSSIPVFTPTAVLQTLNLIDN